MANDACCCDLSPSTHDYPAIDHISLRNFAYEYESKCPISTLPIDREAECHGTCQHGSEEVRCQFYMALHTWGADNEEFNFKDVTEGTGRNKIGYKKIEFCRAQAASGGLKYSWADTC